MDQIMTASEMRAAINADVSTPTQARRKAHAFACQRAIAFASGRLDDSRHFARLQTLYMRLSETLAEREIAARAA
jgi:hypothetical protein